MSDQKPPPSGDPLWHGRAREGEPPDPGWQAPLQQPPPGWGPPPQQQWSPDPYGQYGQAPPSSGSATTALVLGICGIVLCPLVLSIPAWIIGKNARDEAERLPGRPNWGNANAGYILGIIGTILGIVAVVIVVIYLVVIAAAVDSIDDWDTY
ncbi:DUF4190 domain-containing protein [Patulibacter sp. NPDC049589]|uniref:DUF4190 domain-containing protein n=1 Tax=Patulibacter sp. NPDC049589 TaxID=3154731 RepID=UPI0034325205